MLNYSVAELRVYVNAEQIIGLESIRTMMSELKSVYDVLENI